MNYLYSPWNSPGQNTGVGSLSLLQGLFPTQESNPGLLHCRQILYQLSHKGTPRTLEWIAYPFSRGSSQPRNWTGFSCITDGFFTSWATREAPRRHTCWQSKKLVVKGMPEQRAGEKGTQEDCSATRLSVSWWWDLFPGRLWPITLAQSGTYTLLSQEGAREKDSGRWEDKWPFDLSWLLLVGGGLLVLCSLRGPRIIK